ncbi:MAG: hypothetical protein PHN42_02650 [Bacilli bacterium]|nr:hypothetical protein [Bacilli bacterium]
MIKEKNNKIILPIEIILNGINKAKKNNNDIMMSKLIDLFKKTQEDTISFEKNSEIVSFLLIKDNLEINLETLSVGYIKAQYKNNSEIKKELKKYLFEYIRNIEEKIDNEYIVELIKENKKIYEYLKQNQKIEDFEKELYLSEKKKNKNQIINIETRKNQLIKGKAII